MAGWGDQSGILIFLDIATETRIFFRAPWLIFLLKLCYKKATPVAEFIEAPGWPGLFSPH